MNLMQIRFLPWLILVLLIVGMAGSWMSEGLVYQLTRTDMTAADRVACLQEFFRMSGA